jgi:hypothetical protein
VALHHAVRQVADDLVRETGRTLAGAFDRYVCTSPTLAPPPDPYAVPGLSRAGLLADGVEEAAIPCIRSHEAAMRYNLTGPAPSDPVAINANVPERIIEPLDALAEPAGITLDGDGSAPRP